MLNKRRVFEGDYYILCTGIKGIYVGVEGYRTEGTL